MRPERGMPHPVGETGQSAHGVRAFPVREAHPAGDRRRDGVGRLDAPVRVEVAGQRADGPVGRVAAANATTSSCVSVVI
jgi:hypothetical protein